MVGDIPSAVLIACALLVTFVAGYQLYRQRFTSYKIIRDFLVVAYLVITVILVLELWRVTLADEQFMQVYAPLSVGMGLFEAIVLAAAAVGMYLRPLDSDFRTFPGDLRRSPTNAALLGVFTAFTVSAMVYLAAFRPYTITTVASLGGGTVWAVEEPAYYLVLLALVLAFFIGYPTAALYVATRRIAHESLRGSLLSLPISWAGVSILYLLFESLLWLDGLDATAAMFFMNSVIFFFVTRNFRNSAMLAGHVLPHQAGDGEPAGSPDGPTPASFGGMPIASLGGRPILFQADASLGFEDRVMEMATMLLRAGKPVFVFTSRGSRVHQAVASLTGVKMYLMTSNVSSYKPGETENEILVSADNPSVILDAMSKSTAAPQGQGSGVMFDSLSDMILSVGFPSTYKFLKSALEITAERQTVSVFILLSDTHEKNIENTIVTRFPVIVRNTKSGLAVVKAPP